MMPVVFSGGARTPFDQKQKSVRVRTTYGNMVCPFLRASVVRIIRHEFPHYGIPNNTPLQSAYMLLGNGSCVHCSDHHFHIFTDSMGSKHRKL